MTEVWKSQEKKFCDICKCWFGDNRISIDIHEKGKSHKENVKNKLKELAVKGRNDAKNEMEKELMLQEIERKAMEAVKKDKQEQEARLRKERLKRLAPKAWAVAFSEEKGVNYYWNLTTGESCWEEPSEGYYSIEDQKLLGIIEAPGDGQGSSIDKVPSCPQTIPTTSAPPVSTEKEEKRRRKEEKRAAKRKAVEEKEQKLVRPPTPPSLRAKRQPTIHAAPSLGSWKVVDSSATVADGTGLDYGNATDSFSTLLPSTNNELDHPYFAEEEPVSKKFEEKTIKSISGKSTPGVTVFKKRKLGSNRNLKQRDSDD